jgi:heme/copper-type cytochrome/quinol oxidase subunit 4
MPSIAPILLTRTTAVWALLILATVVSWWLGTDHGLGEGSDHRAASVAIVLVAFVKVRLVGLYFMELREAPTALRSLLEAYCLLVCAVVVGMYLAT